MSLSHSLLTYIFLEAKALNRQRELLQSYVGLPVLEVESRPGTRHGVVKYDAGNVILSLNLSHSKRFRWDTSDALVMVFEVDRHWRSGTGLVDLHGHHYAFVPTPEDRARERRPPVVVELRLGVQDLAVSAAFYRDVLGLEPRDGRPDAASFALGEITLTLEEAERAVDGRQARHDTYLLVLHTDDIERSRDDLGGRGLEFSSPFVGSKEIGRTVRFEDPTGHRFCLYEPSEESLTWPSGRKLQELIARPAAPTEIRHP
ncbi:MULTISPECIES: VOC family protein [Actinomadura]|uniref:VOC family protein n=1 Tax=Actinomadura yumaensis TaxID=111807 RepID=A0ABW2D142_9ACTN|nr:VOC family protein [Actinomadura sp. J1-007]